MRSISIKLILAFLAIGLISVVIVVVAARWNTSAEFFRFVSNRNQTSISATLSNYYNTKGSWDGVEGLFPSSSAQPQSGHEINPLPPFTLTDPTGKVVLSRDRYNLNDQIPSPELNNGIRIESNGQTVGILMINHAPFSGDPRANEFIQRTNMTLIYTAIIASALALLLGILLARNITRPIRELTLATHAVADGNLNQQVPVRSRDELGELAKAFNKMSAELARSINSRRQMTADIAHELRTPLSLILGHAEAVHDGVLPPSMENFEIIREEAARLEHLVDDLRTLSLADAGELTVNPQPVSPQRLLEEVSTLYRYQVQKKDVTLDMNIASPLPDLMIDPGRMTQVLTNVLDNALRHTPAGGHIELAAAPTSNGVELSIRDSGPGIASEDAERIFDRFYRADASRHREDGGSGLGLAIAKSIVLAHNGQIRAESEPGKGLAIIITLPVTQ